MNGSKILKPRSKAALLIIYMHFWDYKRKGVLRVTGAQYFTNGDHFGPRISTELKLGVPL